MQSGSNFFTSSWTKPEKKRHVNLDHLSVIMKHAKDKVYELLDGFLNHHFVPYQEKKSFAGQLYSTYLTGTWTRNWEHDLYPPRCLCTLHENYCRWKNSCTSWWKNSGTPIIYKVLYIPGGEGFLPSTVPPHLKIRVVRLVLFRTASCRVPW